MSTRARAGAAVLAALAVLLSCAPRIARATDALPAELRQLFWSDVLFTYVRGMSGGRMPYVHSDFEYPPVIGYVSAAASLLTHDATTYVVLWTVVLALAAAAGAYVMAANVGARRVVMYWALAPQMLLLSGINFDVLPATLLGVGMVAARARRHVTAAVALGIGAAAKFFPLAAAGLAVLRGPRPLLVAASITTPLVLLYVPTLLVARPSSAGVTRYAFEIGANFDSFWGMVRAALDAAFAPAAPGAAVVLAVTTAGLLATYALVVLPRALRTADPAVAFALGVTTVLLWTRLYSPQFSLWLLPVFVLLPLPRRAFRTMVLADVGVFFTVYPLTMVRRTEDDPVAVVLLVAAAVFIVLRQIAVLITFRALLRLAADTSVPRRR